MVLLLLDMWDVVLAGKLIGMGRLISRRIWSSWLIASGKRKVWIIICGKIKHIVAGVRRRDCISWEKGGNGFGP